MNEREKQAIRAYVKRVSKDLEGSREELQQQVINLNAQLAADRLELAEQKIARLVRQHNISYRAALDMVCEELEEKERTRKLKEDERVRARTQVELEEAEKQAALELEDEANNAD